MRFLLEIHRDFRADIGQFITVAACRMEISPSGDLLFFDDNDDFVYARAAGTWVTVCPEEDYNVRP